VLHSPLLVLRLQVWPSPGSLAKAVAAPDG
jgi:hypothetical protein